MRLLSSEAVRCSQTLGPLSAMVGVPIEIHADLLEGASTTATVGLIREQVIGPGDVALCSHGDVIPAVLSTLANEGVVVSGGRGCDKGSIWELEVRDRAIVSARYRSASSLSRDLAST